jgi:hypothetical protein
MLGVGMARDLKQDVLNQFFIVLKRFLFVFKSLIGMIIIIKLILYLIKYVGK